MAGGAKLLGIYMGGPGREQTSPQCAQSWLSGVKSVKGCSGSYLQTVGLISYGGMVVVYPPY